MNRRTLLAAVAGVLAVALIATPAYAQRGGGGGGRGGGGFGGGGGRGYGGGGGRAYGGGGYGGYGGYGRGGYGGYGRGYGYGGYGYGGIGIGIGLGYPAYGGYYGDGYYLGGAYPDYSYSNPTLYGTSPYVVSPQVPYANQPLVGNVPAIGQPGDRAPITYGNGPAANFGNAPTVAMQSFYSGSSASPGTAELTVKVPADAQLWLGSMQSSQQGTERHFSFPALSGGDNMFSLRSTWTENGQTVTREKQVDMKAGQNATVDFTQATATVPPSKPNTGLPAPAGQPGHPPVLPPTTPK